MIRRNRLYRRGLSDRELSPPGGPAFLWRDLFTTPRAAGAINGTSCEPGPGTRTVVDTETCLSILPNIGSALYTHSGVTTTTGTHRCSFATGYGWIDFPTGGNFAPYANSGKLVILYDASGVACWGYLGAAGTGETLGSELVVNGDFSSWSGDNPTGWTLSKAETATEYVTEVSGACRFVSSLAALFGIYQSIITKNRLYVSSINITAILGHGIYLGGGNTAYQTGINITGVKTGGWIAADGANIYIIRSGTTDVTFDDFSVKQVLTPTATGAWIYRDAALTTNGWHIPTAFNRNSTSYTFAVYEPTSGGKLFFQGGKATPASGDPGYWKSEAITRVPGYIGCWKVKPTDATAIAGFGFSNAKTGALVGNSMRISSDTLLPYDGSTAGPSVLVPLDNTDLMIAVILRITGAYFFAKLSTGYWTLLWHTATNNTGTLYAGVSGYSLAALVSQMTAPNTRWLPVPYLSDGFTAADATSNNGRASDGAGHLETTGLGSGGIKTWSGASGAISSNRLVITPTLGSELLPNPGLEAPYSSGLANNWSKDGTPTLTEETTIVHGGSSSQKVVGSANFDGPYKFVTSIGNWYVGSVWVYHPTGDSGSVLSSIIGISGVTITANSTWNYILSTNRANSSSRGVWVFQSGATSATFYIDDASVKPITLSTCINASLFTTPDLTIETAFQMTTGTQAGIILGLDSTSDPKYFILAYHDGNGNIKIEICENGVYTTKATVSKAYASDAVLRVRRDGPQVWVWYNDALIGSVITLSGTEDTNLSGLYAGLFSTYSGNSFNYCNVYPTGTNGEYQILDRLIGA